MALDPQRVASALTIPAHLMPVNTSVGSKSLQRKLISDFPTSFYNKLGMVRSALESVNVFTSWLARSLLLTSMRFDSSLATKYKLKTITNR